jgi:hypothetical protein
MMHGEWRHDQPVLKVLSEKALRNEHFAEVPVKRELKVQGYKQIQQLWHHIF